MGDRVADMGYVALVPDIYYRAGDLRPRSTRTPRSPIRRNGIGCTVTLGTLSNDRIIADANAYTDFLLNRPEVTGAAIGTTGYCFGGRMSMVTAGGLNGKIAAAASFHGGGIAVAGDPSSPHLAANKITATVYVAGAQEDKHFTPEQAELLENALTEAGVDHTVEFYPARHGFAVTDNPVYDADAEARHWEALRTLYAAHLG